MKKIAILACIVIVSMSCGIDTINYLSGNPRSDSASDTALVFHGPATPDASYLGIDIFYKIYASETDADADLASLTARQSATNAVPGYSVSSYLLSASGLSYRKPMLNGSIPIPQLPEANLPSSDYAEIDFSTTMTTEPTISFPSSGPVSYKLHRAVTPNGAYVSFNIEPNAGDADFKSNSGDSDSTTYYVQFFAASFGIDFASGGITELYGDAVFLGRIVLNFQG